VKKMMRDAESHAEEDRKKKELVEVKNQADTLVYSVEKSLKDYGDKVTESEKKDIEAALDRCRKAKDAGTNVSEIKAAIDELTKVSHKIAEHVYKAAQGQPEGGPSTDGGGTKAKSPEEEVVEAEFEDVDKNKNK
jgi:molecular chaperone DnaK